MSNQQVLSELLTLRPKIISYFIKQYNSDYETSEQKYTDALIYLLEKQQANPTKIYTIPYFYTIIHNSYKQEYNTKTKQAERLRKAIDTFYDHYLSEPESSDVLYQTITLRHLWDDVLNYLATKYTIKQLNIFKAKYKSKDTQAQIAKKYGKSEATISVLLSKMLTDVRAEFKETLADKYDEYTA